MMIGVLRWTQLGTDVITTHIANVYIVKLKAQWVRFSCIGCTVEDEAATTESRRGALGGRQRTKLAFPWRVSPGERLVSLDIFWLWALEFKSEPCRGMRNSNSAEVLHHGWSRNVFSCRVSFGTSCIPAWQSTLFPNFLLLLLLHARRLHSQRGAKGLFRSVRELGIVPLV